MGAFDRDPKKLIKKLKVVLNAIPLRKGQSYPLPHLL